MLHMHIIRQMVSAAKKNRSSTIVRSHTNALTLSIASASACNKRSSLHTTSTYVCVICVLFRRRTHFFLPPHTDKAPKHTYTKKPSV